jgi:tetratricopeptide (TPR) repeat protein
VITVACDAKGREAVEPFITAAGQRHPSVLDQKLQVAELYDVRNVPSVFWIDEVGRMVRANDPIYAQRRNRETGETTINTEYLDAVRDWVAKGDQSAYVMDAKRLEARRPALDSDDVEAAAFFQLGTYLAQHGHPEDALVHFKRAHELRPENWTYKRQAWSLGDIERDYGTTFQEALKDPKSGPFYPSLDLVEPGDAKG